MPMRTNEDCPVKSISFTKGVLFPTCLSNGAHTAISDPIERRIGSWNVGSVRLVLRFQIRRARDHRVVAEFRVHLEADAIQDDDNG